MSASTASEMSPAMQLFALANEKSSEKRLELLRRITDSFTAQSEGPSPAVQILLDDIVTKLVERIEGQDRASASVTLAGMQRLPEHVATTLAFDGDIAVARPIIQDYRGLSKSVLVNLASNGSQTHLEAIAGRNSLEADVTDIVVERGNGQVVRTLAANLGAHFSRTGMNTMIGKAANDDHLKELLVNRTDLTLEAVGQLLPLVSQQLAAKLQSADLNFSSALVQEQMVGWMSDRKKAVAQVNRSIQQVRSGAEKLDMVLLELVVERRLLDVATVIAGVSDLDRDYGFNLVVQGKTDNVLVLLRALSVAWPAAQAVLKLRIDKLGAEFCGAMVDQATYESMDVAGAQRVIRFLKVRRVAMAQEKTAVAS